ncbi:InlB B-repeat-containing protein [Robiginitalea marina]|uniref:Bacterial repeat domain-containing protein n=1 Tax=Robiginitalea marina TaxID=2954105 RepID=A0ABT1AZV8_9FLAO|nr:hypothetical protein [Robiginitalea marina]MCO5725556.1 hypothetical protein [Robiginitalea marina]
METAEMLIRSFKYPLLVLLATLLFSGCSSEDDDISVDPTCGRTFELITSVSPEGAGSIERTEYVSSEGLGGLLPTKVIRLFAIPREGYVFEEWKSSLVTSVTKDTENPKLIIPCYISESVKSIKITAVFKALEE